MIYIKSKYLCTLLVFLISSKVFSQEESYATIYGTIKDCSKSFQYFKLDEISSISYGEGLNILMLDSVGNFSATIILDNNPSYFLIGFNEIYLEKNDSIKMTIDVSDPKKSIFEGPGAEKQNYLKFIPYQKSGSYLDGGRNVKIDYQKTSDTIFQLANEQLKQLENLNNANDYFILLERARIKSDIINSLYNIPTYHSHVFKKLKINEKTSSQEYNQLIKPLIEKVSSDFLDENYLPLESYRNVINIINNNQKYRNKIIDDWILSKNTSNRINPKANFKDTTFVNSLNNDIEKISSKYYKSLVLSNFRQVVLKQLNKHAVNFIFKDLNNTDIPLDTYKGQIIYIDFWATYCVPCIQEKSYFYKLKNIYKNNVVFLSLSVDIDYNRWKNFLKKNNKNSDIIEGIVSGGEIQDYFVSQIPRYILIDQNFDIVDLYADSPSSDAIKLKLDKMIIESK